MKGKLGKPQIALGATVAVLLLFPLVYDNPYLAGVLVLANIYTVYVAAWDLLSGYTGQENFGFALFIGSGAYLVGLLTKFVAPVSPWVGIPAGGAAAALVGLVIGIPCLRLKGPYLALATLAAAAIADRMVIILNKYTGGEDGIFGIAYLTGDPVGDYYLSTVFMLLSVGILYSIGHSYVGLLLKAIGQDENAAQAGGVPTTLYKVGAFAVSAFFGGMAGAFNAHYLGYVGPDAVLAGSISLNIIIMAIVGGTGSIVNAALGAYTLAVVGEFLKSFGEVHLLLYTTLLIVVLLFMPQGVFATLRRRREPSSPAARNARGADADDSAGG